MLYVHQENQNTSFVTACFLLSFINNYLSGYSQALFLNSKLWEAWNLGCLALPCTHSHPHRTSLCWLCEASMSLQWWCQNHPQRASFPVPQASQSHSVDMEAFVFMRRIIERQLLCHKWLRAGVASQFLIRNGKRSHEHPFAEKRHSTKPCYTRKEIHKVILQ